MKQWWRARRHLILSGMIYGFASSIYKTLRLRVVGYDSVKSLKTGRIFCGWHGHSLIPANFFRRQDFWVIISQSRDGDMQTRIFSKFGFNIIRGSTGRGGARALIESIRVLRNNGSMAITPDGPRGPSGVVQEGVMMMAQKSGCALIPTSVEVQPVYHAPTWDRYVVPLPFAKAVLAFGEPIYVPEKATAEEVEAKRLELQNAINALQGVAVANMRG